MSDLLTDSPMDQSAGTERVKPHDQNYIYDLFLSIFTFSVSLPHFITAVGHSSEHSTSVLFLTFRAAPTSMPKTCWRWPLSTGRLSTVITAWLRRSSNTALTCTRLVSSTRRRSTSPSTSRTRSWCCCCRWEPSWCSSFSHRLSDGMIYLITAQYKSARRKWFNLDF